ncbi:hypothetical protein J7F03_30505 [Streptomyces sp. ISL-43]|uniref:hypothetical protein n=1 Tax=Streptomyces sp. ISL-43 TaxID=2819183 RepID=UPI001BEAA8E0|nr:hypothetical protein [Streptomyces sp. ISL-43]MBT2451326.1 hypothetical protein [Streptomyces sp. ISL-43]
MGSTDDAQLRSLADDLRKLLDEPVEIAADRAAKSDEGWKGPTADRVRGELGVCKTRLGPMAGQLDKEAAKRKENATGPKPN